jgi:transcriptional regulator with XRE-family HTH domain
MRHSDERIGPRIAQARREAGMTQAQLADELGVTTRSLQGYEAGKVIPYRHLHRLAEATGRTREWFLRGDSEAEVTALGEVGERLVALVEQIAAEAERIAEAASHLEASLGRRERSRGSGGRG